MRSANLLLTMALSLGVQAFVPPFAIPAKDSARHSHGSAVSTRHFGDVGGGKSDQRVLSRRNGRTLRLSPVGAASPSSSPVEYFMGLFGGSSTKRGGGGKAVAEAREADLLSAIEDIEGRGRDVTEEQREVLDRAVEALEGDGGASGAASSPLVDGSWRLIFTTTPGTASPVQRSFVGVDAFAIYQDIDLFSEVAAPTVTNVVDFGPRVGQLRVTALASTVSKPMEGFVPRRGDGLFFGLNILGVSQTTPPKDPSARIDFQFDEAGFDFKAFPFTIPYPVPFRWLGDEVKGWIDVTYLSENLRIARGNKGTLFVLQRPPSS
ncbi:unnamed protein product [Laminaria digitata]